jgi:type IV secretion system protein VirD4
MNNLVPVPPSSQNLAAQSYEGPNGLEAVYPDMSPETIHLGRHYDPINNHSRKLTYNGERNLLVLGPNGCGKSAFLLTTNLVQMHGNRSLVVVDPKGELTALTAPYRRTVGKVIILNPYNLHVDKPGYEDMKSNGYNPFLALDPASETFLSDVMLISEGMVTVNQKDPYWDLSARDLIAALIMFVVLEARGLIKPYVIDAKRHVTPTVPTVGRMRELLCQPSGQVESLMRVGEMENAVWGLPHLALKLSTCEWPELRNRAGQFTTWEKDVQSVVRTAMVQTSNFDEVQMRRDLESGTTDLTDLKRTPTTIYLILPVQKMQSQSRWLRMIISSALNVCMRERNPGEPRVLFMLDEFFSLGYLESIANNWSVVRGFGVQIMPVLQSLTQLKQLYGDLWENFMANTGVVASFTPNDFTTADWLSKRAGDTTRMQRNWTASRTITNTTGGSHGKDGSSSNWSNTNTDTESLAQQPTKLPLVTAHKMFGQPRGLLALFIAGRSNPTAAIAPPWWKITQCKERITRENPYKQRV